MFDFAVTAMTQANRFALTFETLAELATEIRSAHADPRPALPNLSEVLAEFSPLADETLFLGVANDGLPVLLNLRDPLPGPILIAGDPGTGKTRLLQIIARGVDQIHRPQNIKYVVVTKQADEWNAIHRLENCVGILPASDAAAANYLSSLAEWAHNNKGENQIVLLMADDLEAVISSCEAHQHLRWLLLRGPARRVWPIVTLSSAQARNLQTWLDAFRTRLFGHIEDSREAQILTGRANCEFKDLIPGSQFAMREGSDWLPFWIPNLD